MVLAQVPITPTNNLRTLQLNSHIRRAQQCHALTILPDTPTRRRHPHHSYCEPDDRPRLLWDRSTEPRGRSAGGHVKQTTHALRVRHGNKAIHACKPLSIPVGTGDIVTTTPRILWQIQLPLNTLLDENVVGEGLQVWSQDGHC
jgi:hypothetical protein